MITSAPDLNEQQKLFREIEKAWKAERGRLTYVCSVCPFHDILCLHVRQLNCRKHLAKPKQFCLAFRLQSTPFKKCFETVMMTGSKTFATRLRCHVKKVLVVVVSTDRFQT
jgi:hypothetical protein